MIRYQLKCAKGHGFEAWFKSSADYDRQAERRLVECAVCGSDRVEKALMAPAVVTRKRRARPEAPEPEAAGGPEEALPVAQTSGASDRRRAAIEREMRALARKLRREIEANADYVGPRFAEEARRIHNEEAPRRGIYGEATPEEARALREEGIEFHPLPRLPDEAN